MVIIMALQLEKLRPGVDRRQSAAGDEFVGILRSRDRRARMVFDSSVGAHEQCTGNGGRQKLAQRKHGSGLLTVIKGPQICMYLTKYCKY